MDQKQQKELELLHESSFTWALHCCGMHYQLAEDVLQTVYLKILVGKAKYHERSAYKTWLFSIIRFTAIDQLKKRNKYLFDSNTVEQYLQSTHVLIKDSNQNLYKQKLFLQLLQQLSPQQREVLHLVFYQGLTIEEAAKIMKIQLGTARTHYKRGKAQLKKLLISRGGTVNLL